MALSTAINYQLQRQHHHHYHLIKVGVWFVAKLVYSHLHRGCRLFNASFIVTL